MIIAAEPTIAYVGMVLAILLGLGLGVGWLWTMIHGASEAGKAVDEYIDSKKEKSVQEDGRVWTDMHGNVVRRWGETDDPQ